jgi:hypothetical protein
VEESIYSTETLREVLETELGLSLLREKELTM